MRLEGWVALAALQTPSAAVAVEPPTSTPASPSPPPPAPVYGPYTPYWSPPPASPRPIETLAESPPIERSFAIEGHGSFGGPYGMLGVAFDFAPIPYLALNLGFGMSHGFQLGAMGRFRAPLSDTIAIGFEAGVSAGGYVDDPCQFRFDCQQSFQRVWDWAVWRNLGIDFERRSPGGFHLRAYAGNARLLNPGDYTCDDKKSLDPCEIGPPETPLDLLYLGVGVGAAFDP